MQSPWGELKVSDAHVHFFTRGFFGALARQRKLETPDAVAEMLGWRAAPEDAVTLAQQWVRELDRHQVSRAAIIASVPGDELAACEGAQAFPARLAPYAMFDPTAADAPARVTAALARGLRGLCLFPAMHRYSLHDERVKALLDLAAAAAGCSVFVHAGVLTVGVRAKLGLGSAFDMRYSNPIDLHAIALEYPRLNFIVPHFGAGYLREALMLCDLCANVYLDTSSSNSWIRYESLSLREVFRRALEVAGPRRLLFGSDSSYFPRGWHAAVFEQQAKALYEIGVEEDQAAEIFGGNLDRLHA